MYVLNGRKIIALCTARINDAQLSKFISELNCRLIKSGASLFVYSIDSELYWNEDDISAEVSVYDLIDFDITDAVIIMDERIKSHTVSQSIVSAAHSHDLPVIVVDGKYDNTVSVCFDYEKGFEKVVRHVIEYHSVRKPHFMAGIRGNVFSEKRIEIFKKVIADNNIPFDESMVSYGDFWAKPAAEAAQRIVDSGELPEAVICANDIMAIYVCNVFADNGIKVPEQIIVTGFDGLDEIYLTLPKISSACCDSTALAKAVYSMLSDLFDGKRDLKDTSVEPVLLSNSSCGCGETCNSDIQLDTLNNSFYHYQDDLRIMLDISGKMQISDTPEQMAANLHHFIFHDMFCIVNKGCLCSEVNYFSESVADGFDREMYMIYHSESDNYELIPVERSQSGSHSLFAALLEKGCPIVFNSLVFMEKTLGYVCFFFDIADIIDRSRIFQISAAIGIGLGGYINRQYQKYLSDKVEEMYKNDALTKLYNRNGFNAAFGKLKAQPDRYGEQVTIIAADLDGLKYINDNFGHDAGDHAISTVAQILKESCPEDALCVRYGGDEMMAVILGEYSPGDITEKIDRRFSALDRTSELGYSIFASCGYYSTYLTNDFDLDHAIKQADLQMYENKNLRKRKINTVH